MDLPAKSSRLALGAPILSERLDVTDRELGAEITDPPYRQYFFLGLVAYQEEAPFQHSLLTIFRNWASSRSLAKINDALAQLPVNAPPKDEAVVSEEAEVDRSALKNQQLVDATCVPAGIKYPTASSSCMTPARKPKGSSSTCTLGELLSHEEAPDYRQKAR